MTDVGIVQNPMFGTGTPGRFARLLPGYGSSRAMVDGAFSRSFHTGVDLLIGLAWLVTLAVAVYLTLRRALGTRPPAPIGADIAIRSGSNADQTRHA